jgi:hypothetical protein
VSASAHLHDPQALYRHWEHEQWNSWAIDLEADKGQWHGALADYHVVIEATLGLTACRRQCPGAT